MSKGEFWRIDLDYPEKYDDPERYDFTEENTSNNYKELNGLERFFTYMIKFKGKSCSYGKVKEKYTQLYNQQIFENLVDPDSKCMLLREIYKILWNERYLDFRGGFISGETMNSANTTFNRYVQLSPYNKFKQGKGILGTINLYYSNDEFKTYLDFNNNLVEFINIYHAIGNFIPFPAGCNSPRGYNNPRIEDYWDLTLRYIYNYYYGDMDAIKNIYLNTVIEMKFKSWLDEFGSWKAFVEKNYLQSFVNKSNDGTYGEPVELWMGHFSGEVLPTEINQCNEYFKKAHDMILARGALMVEALKEEENI